MNQWRPAVQKMKTKDVFDGRKMNMSTKANLLAAAISLAIILHSFSQEPAVQSKTDSANLEIKIQGNTISGITHGKDLHIAVGQTGTILTSPDGVTWTRQNSRTSQEVIQNNLNN
jgi:hypothetical protein